MIPPSQLVPFHNDPVSELARPMSLCSRIECHMSCEEVSVYRFMPREDNLLVPVGINDNQSTISPFVIDDNTHSTIHVFLLQLLLPVSSCFSSLPLWNQSQGVLLF